MSGSNGQVGIKIGIPLMGEQEHTKNHTSGKCDSLVQYLTPYFTASQI
jgi:hypothetical protein